MMNSRQSSGRRKWLFTFMGLLFVVAGFIYLKFIRSHPPISPEDRASVSVMPLPAELKLTGHKLILPSSFSPEVRSADSTGIISDALERFFSRLERLVAPANGKVNDVPLRIVCSENFRDTLFAPGRESYQLSVYPGKIILKANTPAGILYGLETLLQLVDTDHDIPFIPGVRIKDYPRFPWRGLMIDVCRHWIPKDVILRNLDAMAAVKLNVLHLHLTEYQAFRIESKVFPLLQEKGSDGNYFTQDDIREIIRYAAERGIRVVPEFDLPGHCTSWFAGYPELATIPGQYVPDTTYGVLYPVMDPTREEVYRFLDRFFGEMASLFPDPYIHIGGDEVNPKQWNESEHVQQFMKEHNLQDAHALQAYFNRRLEEILERHGKKMMGWDEILSPALPKDIVVQSWRNQKSLFEAVRRGGQAVLSAGYYLDHKLPAATHYAVDPVVMPGAVDIEPDTLHWRNWNIEMKAADTDLNGALVLFGKPGNLRGFLSFMENRLPFRDAQLEEGRLQFEVHSDYGKIRFQMKITGDSISGKGTLGVIGLKVSGLLAGSNEMPGTTPPEFERIRPLDDQEKKRVLGGEACMWSEVVNKTTIESRIWPRTAAIAEKLWSPAELTQDTEDMYRRLEYTDRWVALLGVRHHEHYLEQINRLAAGGDPDVLKSFADLLEEVKYYNRMSIYHPLTVYTPLNRLVDAVWPESNKARRFNNLVQEYVSGNEVALRDSILSRLELWEDLPQKLTPIAAQSPEVNEAMPLAESLGKMSVVTLSLFSDTTAADRDKNIRLLDSLAGIASAPVAGCLLAVDDGFANLAHSFETAQTGKAK